MKFPQILSVLTEEPLLLIPAAQASYLKMFQDHATMSREEFKAAREGVDMCGDATEIPQAELIDGIMHIPIGGPLGWGLGNFEKGAGCVDYQDVIDELDQAETDPNCRGILLNFDSPGGMVQGIRAVTQRIMMCEKTVKAFTDGGLCSAAYWMASACDTIHATYDADIGSIGVYCYLLDASKRYEDAGYKPILVTSGPYKGMGAPGIPFTQEQLQLLQERINGIAEEFYAQVDMTRSIAREDMRGQTFPGEQALTKGFVDGIVSDVEDVAALF